MLLQYLGTAAAEAVPAIFCTCEVCKHARAVGGREIRTRAGSLLDGRIKLDFGPDTYHHALCNGLDYTHIHSVLITHSHEDHLLPCDLSYRREAFAVLPADEPLLTVYGNEAVGKKIAVHLGSRLAFQLLRPYEPVDIEGYRVTPLDATHMLQYNATEMRYPVYVEGKAYARAENTFIYLIEKDGKALLYAHDTGRLADQTLAYLAGRKLDLVSLDCTNARIEENRYLGHMSARDNLEMREKLLKSGAADAHTLFVANHFSHNALVPFDALEKLLPGFLITYDGMKLEF